MPTPQLQQVNRAPEEKESICLFAQTNYRNALRRFGIKLDDRRRHMYVIGKTGMGKTTMLENMVLHDIYNGHGIGIVDPHGDFAEKIINYVPSNRINDVIYVNPADVNFPIGFNILEVYNEEQKHLVAAGLMGVFKKIWPDVWSSRMEYILNNTLLALLDYPGSTLLGINRMLSDKKYRKRVVAKLTDPVIKSFWQNEFANYEERYRKEAVAPIQNKIGQFLSASIIRNMVAQVKSTINIREAMDSNKILIMNLSKGRIGEDNSRLLGGMLITKIQLAAMERVDIPEKERKDFFLYVDEFQNFATESFANILSEARKYRLGLVMAHQYIAQLEETVRDAVFGNVGTIVSFRVGAADAMVLAAEYAPVFIEEDLVNLSKFNVFLKLMIDGVASQPFSANTLPPIGSPTGNAEKVIRVSRERYAKQKEEIEDKITRWSGMEADTHPEEDSDDGKKKERDKGKEKAQKKNKDATSKDNKEDTKGSKDADRSRNSDERKQETKNTNDQKKEDGNHVVEKSHQDQDDEDVSGPETISLDDLRPKSSDEVEEQHDSPVTKDETTIEETSDVVKKEMPSEVSEKKQASSSQSDQSNESDGGTKKKRRRRRRKKKSDSEEQKQGGGRSKEQDHNQKKQSDSGGNASTRDTDAQGQRQERSDTAQSAKQDHPPAQSTESSGQGAGGTLRPDEIIQFND